MKLLMAAFLFLLLVVACEQGRLAWSEPPYRGYCADWREG